MKINHILKAKFHKIELSPGFKKYFLNTDWLLFNNIFGMVLTLFVEAYVKWLGKGMAIPFESFDVLSFRKAPKLYSTLCLKYCITICIDGSLLKEYESG